MTQKFTRAQRRRRRYLRLAVRDLLRNITLAPGVGQTNVTAEDIRLMRLDRNNPK